MVIAIAYQIPAIIGDEDVVPEYRMRENTPSANGIAVLCFQRPDRETVRRTFGNLDYRFERVDWATDLVNKYAELHRKLKKEHGKNVQVNWGNVSSELIRLYEKYLSFDPMSKCVVLVDENDGGFMSRRPEQTSDSLCIIRPGGRHVHYE